MPKNRTSAFSGRFMLCAALGVAFCFAAAACSESGPKKRKGAESFQIDKTQLIVKPGVVLDVDIAKSEDARIQYPKNQYALCETCGVLIAYGEEVNGRFSTEGMQMDVDVVWMNHFTVIGIATDLKSPAHGEPVSTSLSPGKATEMLLLASGGVGRLGISQGMQLRLTKG